MKGATITSSGHDTWIRVRGTFVPASSAMSNVPSVPGPIVIAPPDPTASAPPRTHLSIQGSITLVGAWLNWSDPSAQLVAYMHETHPDYAWPICDALLPANASVSCFTPLGEPVSALEPDVWVDGTAPKSVEYELTILASSAPLPLLGAPAPLAAFTPRVSMPLTPNYGMGEYGTGEPSLAIAPSGTVYVAAPITPLRSLWHSLDGGASFSEVQIKNTTTDPGSFYDRGAGDSEVTVGSDRTVYFVDQQGIDGQTVSASHDGGKTWVTTPFGASPIPGLPGEGRAFEVAYVSSDRPWIVASGDMDAWMSWSDADGAGRVSRTVDGGRTWVPLGQFDAFKCGNLARAEDGTMYSASCTNDALIVDVSTDDGVTFTPHTVAPSSVDAWDNWAVFNEIPSLATDAKGDAFLVWADSARAPLWSIWMSRSVDHGSTWSTPSRIATGIGKSVQPSITADGTGHVAIAFYGTRSTENMSWQRGEWYPMVAESHDALDASPTWNVGTIGTKPIAYGPLCMGGDSCGAGRELLDFLTARFDPQGRLNVAFTDGWASPFTMDTSRIEYARAEAP